MPPTTKKQGEPFPSSFPFWPQVQGQQAPAHHWLDLLTSLAAFHGATCSNHTSWVTSQETVYALGRPTTYSPYLGSFEQVLLFKKPLHISKAPYLLRPPLPVHRELSKGELAGWGLWPLSVCGCLAPWVDPICVSINAASTQGVLVFCANVAPACLYQPSNLRSATRGLSSHHCDSFPCPFPFVLSPCQPGAQL